METPVLTQQFLAKMAAVKKVCLVSKYNVETLLFKIFYFVCVALGDRKYYFFEIWFVITKYTSTKAHKSKKYK